MLNNGLITVFGNTIVSWSVMHGELLLHASGFEIQSKSLIQVLASLIGMKNLDRYTKVCHAPSLILFVGFKGFGFQVEKVEMG